MKFQVLLVSSWDAIAYETSCEELAIKGLFLSKMDMQEIMNTVQMACRQYKLMETDTVIVFQCIDLFQASPYARTDNFLQIIKDALYVYYFLRCNISHKTYDEDILKVVYESYLLAFGKFNKEMRKKCVSSLVKE